MGGLNIVHNIAGDKVIINGIGSETDLHRKVA